MRKKLKNMTTKITDEIYESQRTREGFRPLFPLQISVQTPLKIQQIFDLSHKLEEANHEIKGGNESGEREVREMGAPSSYLIGILYIICPWIQMSQTI
jgi:hypothetical protein